MNAIIGKIPIWEDPGVSARSIWKRPPMRFGTIVGDEANGTR
jgi:hypothetical protein